MERQPQMALFTRAWPDFLCRATQTYREWLPRARHERAGLASWFGGTA
jgi:hypothetical protein